MRHVTMIWFAKTAEIAKAFYIRHIKYISIEQGISQNIINFKFSEKKHFLRKENAIHP